MINKNDLRLEISEHGVDVLYNDWYVVTVTDKGGLVRHAGIAPGVGLKVNDTGKIKLVKAR